MSFQTDLLVRHWAALLEGLGVTLLVTLAGGIIAIAGGALLCAMRLRERGALVWVARGFILVFRTTPEVILVFWAYFCVPLLLGQRVSGFWAGTVTLGLIGAAYLGEIFRGGINTVPKSQREAAHALGLPRVATWGKVILPQALRFSLPPLVNYFTEFLKNTTILATIGVAELSLKAYLLGGQTFRYIEFLTAIAVIYFLVIFPISFAARRLEHAPATR